MSNKVPVSKILVFRKESDLSYSFSVVIIYILKAGKFLFLVYTLDFGFQGEGEDRVVGTIMACLVTAEAKTFLNANLLFLWGELPDVYGINIHSIWILGFPNRNRGKARVYGRRGGLMVLGLL